MNVRAPIAGHVSAQGASVDVMARSELDRCRRWADAFHGERKDHRYYEVVEDTISGFDYRYFVIRDEAGVVRAVAPFFLLDQDLLVGTDGPVKAIIDRVRRLWPRFMHMRTLMIGCAAGEGHLDDGDELSHADQARL